jgi:hypothetical protein
MPTEGIGRLTPSRAHPSEVAERARETRQTRDPHVGGRVSRDAEAWADLVPPSGPGARVASSPTQGYVSALLRLRHEKFTRMSRGRPSGSA